MSAPATLLAGEAAVILGATPEAVRRLARHGRLEGVRVDGVWLLDGDPVQEYATATTVRHQQNVRRLPADPLLRADPPAWRSGSLRGRALFS